MTPKTRLKYSLPRCDFFTAPRRHSMASAKKRLLKKPDANGFRKCCFYCHVKLRKEDATVDHYIPLSRGGSSNIHNLRLCCYSCNQLKGSKTSENFMHERAIGCYDNEAWDLDLLSRPYRQ